MEVVCNMHFQNYEPVQYKHNILFHVVFQARFPEIMRIQHEPPIAFQDAMRTEGYTEINHSVPPILPGIIPNQALDVGRLFHFLTEQRDWEVTLAQDFMSLGCHRNYSSYSEFKEKLEKVLRIFHKIYRPSYFTRIGLMYRNMANKTFLSHLQQVDIESFIPEHIFPVLATPMAGDVLSLQTMSQFDDNEIRATVTHTLSQVSGGFGHRQVTNERSYIIDIDCFYERNVGVIDEVFTKCDLFKELERNIFEWSITDTLRGAMGKSES
ncbi:TIGR04255 family protein [Candidatus Poribacteria bacterium]|nr:TIGR04255 family protein [Candidatus Poribacteria bacterium]